MVEPPSLIAFFYSAHHVMNQFADLNKQLSWRDPDGFVVNTGSQILRAVVIEKREQVRTLLNAPWIQALIAEGAMPKTAELVVSPDGFDLDERWCWLTHEVLFFPCFPHEITALQLYDAAQLTLRIAIDAAKHGWVLKDASAWNVLYSRGRAVFVDFLSFDQLEPSGTWLPYAQFVRNFLLPLMLYRKMGIIPPDVFCTNRDGITPERAQELLGSRAMMSRIGLEFVVLPRMLSTTGTRLIASETAHKPRSLDNDLATHLILRTLRRLQGKLDKLQPDKRQTASTWLAYEEERNHYSGADLAAKKGFVRNGVQGCAKVLDLGCNAGEFSLLAAESGATVVAADADHGALSRLYLRFRDQDRPITALHLNIGRPTPAVGWQNKEVASFLERAGGSFDCILALGLLHHLIISERIGLSMIVDLMDRLSPKKVILEWIDPLDPKFQQLAGFNQELYSALTDRQLEDCFTKKFRLVSKLMLPCATRVMYEWCR